jgi:lactate dehydrogenase-like 2-hydroxyacid dehydrogenase
MDKRQPRLLQTGPITPGLDARLPELYDVHLLWREADPAAFLAAEGIHFEGIATHAMHACPQELIDALPRARVIASFGAGSERINHEAAKRRGIQVFTTPGINVDCVADMAFGLLIDVARGISASDRLVRRGDWARGAHRPLMNKVSGKRLGLLGFGQIGAAIARRSEGFGMAVRYHARHAREGVAAQREQSLEALAQWADFLVIACAGGPATHHLVNGRVLDALGPEGLLVNIARGTVVDEEALVERLASGRLGGAALDVYANEPHVPAALMEMDKVILLPHVAGFTRETRAGMEQLFLDNLRTGLGGNASTAPSSTA